MTLSDSFILQIITSSSAGFVTFFASCLLPLVPTYLAYLSGIAVGTPQVKNHQWQLVKTAAIFSFGFIVSFMALGISFATLGSFLSLHRNFLEKAGGIIFIIIGLLLLGKLQTSWLNREFRFDIGTRFRFSQNLQAFIAGIAFAFGWTPCVGPVLAMVLFWATHVGTQLHGTILLGAFGLGLGIPFVLVALAYEQVLPLFRKSQHGMQVIQKIAGGFVLFSGVLMLLGKFHLIAMLLTRITQFPTLSQ